MSEPDTETPVVPETPTEEPVSPPETPEENPDAEPAEPIEGDDEDAGEATEAPEGDEAQARALTEKALEKRSRALDKENERHATTVGKIMEEAAVDLIPCPVCMDGIAGWVYTPEVQALAEDAQLRLRQLLGLSGLEGLKQATFAQRCPACDGQGEVKTDSRVPGYETADCESCHKMGWIRTAAPSTNGLTHPEGELVVTGPTVFPSEVSDPQVRSLQERGFTVIPPFQPVNPG